MKNVHLDPLRDRLGHSSRLIDDHLRFLFICYTNRCGSNLVAQLLASTGAFNLAGEFFNYDTTINQIEKNGLKDVVSYFDYLCRRVAKKGTLVSKLAVSHLQLLGKAGILDQIIEKSRFIVVERSDRLMQAISLSIAAQTGQWTSYMPSRIPPEDIVYSRKQLEAIIENTVEQQRIFDLFFGLNGIEQLKITYEQLVAAPEIHLTALSKWLGTDIGKVDLAQIPLQRQMSERNMEWRHRFLSGR
jgi:LPS sulfotransferase NodH